LQSSCMEEGIPEAKRRGSHGNKQAGTA